LNFPYLDYEYGTPMEEREDTEVADLALEVPETSTKKKISKVGF